MQRRALSAAPVGLAALAALAWLAIYLPDAGRGFIKDDWAWLLRAPLAPSPWDAAWSASTGFFRPIVSFSFTANHAVFGLSPLGYGLTNVALALACGGAIYWLARSWQVGTGGAVVAAFLWLFTPYGMDMAVIWISGRSALLLVLFATTACACMARGYRVSALALTAAALLSKDEAVVLPVLLAISTFAAGRSIRGRDAAAIAGSLALLAAYFWLRTASGAHMPWNAPEEYRPVIEAGHLASNAMQYADRTLTFPLAVTLIAAFLTVRRGAKPLTAHRALAGLPWAAIAILPTIALPVRSSLYVLLPLVGSAILFGHIVGERVSAASARRRLFTAAAALVLLATLVPFHRSRQREWSGAARLSARITEDAASRFSDVPEGSRIVVTDRIEQPNLESTFGNLLPEMLKVTTGKEFELVAAPARATSILLAPVTR